MLVDHVLLLVAVLSEHQIHSPLDYDFYARGAGAATTILYLSVELCDYALVNCPLHFPPTQKSTSPQMNAAECRDAGGGRFAFVVGSAHHEVGILGVQEYLIAPCSYSDSFFPHPVQLWLFLYSPFLHQRLARLGHVPTTALHMSLILHTRYLRTRPTQAQSSRWLTIKRARR